MTISFVGGVAGGNTNGNPRTLDLSTLGMLAGDIVVICGAAVTQGTTVLPGDYTALTTLSDTTCNATIATAYKIMGATPDSSVTISGDGVATSGTAACALVFRGS